jgi:uncharacterized membrane protein YozB (DUF420 family)
MTDILHQPGFLGTSANWAADMTLLLSALVALLLTAGAVLARRGQYGAHRWVQTTAVLLNAVLVLWLMVLPFRDFVASAAPAELPSSAVLVAAPLSPAALLTTRIHALFGTVTLLLGVFVMLRGNGLVPRFLRFENYKAFMRVSYGLYMITTLIGLFVYITWFVGNPNPPSY